MTEEEREREQKRALAADLKRDCDTLLNMELLVLQQLDAVVLRESSSSSPVLVRRVKGIGSLCDPCPTILTSEERVAVLHEYMNVLHSTTQFIGEMEAAGECGNATLQSVAAATSQMNGQLADIVTAEKKLAELESRPGEREKEKERESEDGRGKAKGKVVERASFKKARSVGPAAPPPQVNPLGQFTLGGICFSSSFLIFFFFFFACLFTSF
jgi:hypothetical protein